MGKRFSTVFLYRNAAIKADVFFYRIITAIKADLFLYRNAAIKADVFFYRIITAIKADLFLYGTTTTAIKADLKKILDHAIPKHNLKGSVIQILA